MIVLFIFPNLLIPIPFLSLYSHQVNLHHNHHLSQAVSYQNYPQDNQAVSHLKYHLVSPRKNQAVNPLHNHQVNPVANLRKCQADSQAAIRQKCQADSQAASLRKFQAASRQECLAASHLKTHQASPLSNLLRILPFLIGQQLCLLNRHPFRHNHQFRQYHRLR